MLTRTSSITPQTGRRIDRVIIIVLVIALGFFAIDKYVLRSHAPGAADVVPVAETSEPVQADDGPPEKSVAVLPFVAIRGRIVFSSDRDGDDGVDPIRSDLPRRGRIFLF